MIQLSNISKKFGETQAVEGDIAYDSGWECVWTAWK